MLRPSTSKVISGHTQQSPTGLIPSLQKPLLNDMPGISSAVVYDNIAPVNPAMDGIMCSAGHPNDFYELEDGGNDFQVFWVTGDNLKMGGQNMTGYADGSAVGYGYEFPRPTDSGLHEGMDEANRSMNHVPKIGVDNVHDGESQIYHLQPDPSSWSTVPQNPATHDTCSITPVPSTPTLFSPLSDLQFPFAAIQPIIPLPSSLDSTTSIIKYSNTPRQDANPTNTSLALRRSTRRRKPPNQSSSKSPRFTCPILSCSKTFSRRFNLTAHLRTHDPQRPRPFNCNQCRSSFVRAHDLLRHASVHSSNKPYSCPICETKFTRMDALRRHEKMAKCASGTKRKDSAVGLGEELEVKEEEDFPT
ncbi:hypothetical protein SpCBS45565_g02956 [Spizellomyces sp. 'palustris']|nr:hypothetical protein SpCBS45565_g02956 [Spizellomyces sp. 'palustris']